MEVGNCKNWLCDRNTPEYQHLTVQNRLEMTAQNELACGEEEMYGHPHVCKYVYYPALDRLTNSRHVPHLLSEMTTKTSYFSIPFLMHILGELGASYGFFVHPSSTLLEPQPFAHPVIRQYALLLISTNLIAAIFLFQDQPSSISCRVAGALALYHLGPLTRAALKMRCGEKMGVRERLGGAWVHGVFHSVTFVALLWEAARLSEFSWAIAQ